MGEGISHLPTSYPAGNRPPLSAVCLPMRISIRWLIAALIVVLLALSMTSLLPGSDETTGDTQPGPIPQSPAPPPQ